ncbi:MAG: DNA gyrase inhibitor YacG [Myxococcales bacterium]|nr:DNA gyrase inhibitor YacG [Myxococcales bacterium]MCB9579208.1 DNA gyrase inhibitor YacG [Polyangiaceae bacterium]
MTINCPICKKTISDAPDDWEFRPFCSSRCKLVDLSNWLDERYRIPGPLVDEDDGSLIH